MTRVFTAPQVVQLVPHLDYSRLDYWTRQGIRPPSIMEAHGRGTRRVYSLWDVAVLRVLSLLRHEGYGLERLRVLDDFLNKTVHAMPEDPTYILLFVAEEFIAIGEDPITVVKHATENHDVLCIIPLGKFVKELLDKGDEDK